MMFTAPTRIELSEGRNLLGIEVDGRAPFYRTREQAIELRDGLSRMIPAMHGSPDNKPDPTYSNASHPVLDLVAAFHMKEAL